MTDALSLCHVERFFVIPSQAEERDISRSENSMRFLRCGRNDKESNRWNHRE